MLVSDDHSHYITYLLIVDQHSDGVFSLYFYVIEINEFLLYSQQSFVKGKILNDTRQGFIDAMQPITEESARFVGLDFDAHDNYIYYSDDLQDVIYRARRNGTGEGDEMSCRRIVCTTLGK